MDGKWILVLGPDEHLRFQRHAHGKVVRLTAFLIGPSFTMFRNERGQGTEKNLFKVFLPCFAYFAALKKSYGGEPERLGIICLDFHCFVLLFFWTMSS